MPVHYERDDARHRIVVTSIGHVTLDETLAIMDRQANDGAWSYSILYDARANERIPTAADLQRLVLRIGNLTMKYGPRGRVAFVVLDRTHRKMARHYERMAALTAADVQVFTTIEEAERWLEKEEV
jgi:hypothetical protein